MGALSNVGWLACLLGLSALWFIAGWQWCESRHKTRGLEVDAHVPDIVPPSWSGGPDLPDPLVYQTREGGPRQGWMGN